MKKASLLPLVLLLGACHEEPAMTFGLNFRVGDSTRPVEQASCIPPGANSGETTGSSIDNWEIGEPPPHLFMDAEPDAEDDVYRVRVYVAYEIEKGGIWWEPSEILAERVYDVTFGESGGQDSFVVDFEGEPYTVEVVGIPAHASCPSYDSDPA